ncbi:MAG: spore coat protein YlbD [Bacilli bacterium]
MNKIDLFKEFVKRNPQLIKHVKEGNMTWQKYFEIFDLYGENSSEWNQYINKQDDLKQVSTNTLSFTDLLGFFKGMNLDAMQEGLNSVGRVVSVLQELGGKENNRVAKPEYKPRPLYKHFED